MNDLKNISTEELVKELEGRVGVQTFKSKLYNGYNVDIVEKFSVNRTPIELPIDRTVLVIEEKFDIKQSEETIWRRFELIDATKEDKLFKLQIDKGLSREDLMLILKTVKLRKDALKPSQSLINLGQSIDNLELTIGWLKEAKTEKQLEITILEFQECAQSLKSYCRNLLEECIQAGK